MCGHVNWRVIDEQITLRVHAATDVGNERVPRASKNEREREGEREKNRGLSRTRRYTRELRFSAAPRHSARFLARLRRQEFHLQPFDVEAARQGLERTLLLITTLPSPRATFAR